MFKFIALLVVIFGIYKLYTCETITPEARARSRKELRQKLRMDMADRWGLRPEPSSRYDLPTDVIRESAMIDPSAMEKVMDIDAGADGAIQAFWWQGNLCFSGQQDGEISCSDPKTGQIVSVDADISVPRENILIGQGKSFHLYFQEGGAPCFFREEEKDSVQCCWDPKGKKSVLMGAL